MKPYFFRSVPFILLLSLLFLSQTAHTSQAAVLYATESAAGSGSCLTWSDACTLATALGSASSGDEIWVASGTHVPGAARSDSFTLISGVGVYGGFAGTETLRSERDPDVNLTILSGDIDGDDSQSPITDLDTVTGNSNNSYQVVITSGTDATAVLDGFTITGGFNEWHSGGDAVYWGAGIYNVSGSPTLGNLVVTGNAADITSSGGGSGEGGGLWSSGSPSLTDVTFGNNRAGDKGGGMYSKSGDPTLTRVTFSNNSAYAVDYGLSNGGGMYIFSGSPTLTGVTFDGNTGENGGGLYNYGDPVLSNVTFSGNSGSYGGGMYIWTGQSSLTNVTFSGNSAQYRGGGIL